MIAAVQNAARPPSERSEASCALAVGIEPREQVAGITQPRRAIKYADVAPADKAFIRAKQSGRGNDPLQLAPHTRAIGASRREAVHELRAMDLLA
jgi:hypothetical protein